jgi:hypothetical protein
VVFLAILAALNLFVSIGLVAQVKALQLRVAQLESDPGPMLPVGEQIGPFASVTVTGQPFSHSDLEGQTLVGFFDWNCEVCHDRLPEFATAARDQVSSAVAVVRGTPEEAAEMTAVLDGIASVVVEAKRGPLARAFHLYATPAFCLLDGILVKRTGYTPEDVLAEVS